jgi:transposase-like protein
MLTCSSNSNLICPNRGVQSSFFTFYRFPERHWKHIRTTNVLERSFKEVRRRTNVVGRFPNETSALVMVFDTLEEERLR